MLGASCQGVVVGVGQKPVDVVPITPPPEGQRVRRNAAAAAPGEKRSRYTLPAGLKSASPVGYRVRVPLTRDEAVHAVRLLSMERPTAFGPREPVTEGELFDETALGTLTARQSTNFQGHRQICLGPDDSDAVAALLRRLGHRDADVLDGATHTLVVLTRPYRTAFTLLLTLIGHKPVSSLLTVPIRAFRKKVFLEHDIPTIGYLQQLHVGVLADAMERAAVLASGGRRRAQLHQAPFLDAHETENRPVIAEIEALCGLTRRDRFAGWRVALVAQVGTAAAGEAVDIPAPLCRKIGANLMAFRSERIQPGVNAEDKAPPAYQTRQDMDVPDELTVMAGRAAYNAFAQWTACDREHAKELLLLERIDVLTPNGKERIRTVRKMLEDVTDQVVRRLPKWADLPTGRAFSKNAARGRKAFALAGQRIYLVGLSRREIDRAGIEWDLAVRAVGAACARGGLVAELMGVTDLPSDCDLLAGICLMAGPVNQNDIGKQFYGQADLLANAFPDRDPTTLLVWTLKAKTVADPIGNEEQLLSADKKGALVDLRPGPHEVVTVRIGGVLTAFREDGGRFSEERAFADVGNFVTGPDGTEIVGNRGATWPGRQTRVW